MKKLGIAFIMLWGMSFCLHAAPAPTLFDIEIEGSVKSPQLSIQDLQLEMNQEYLFVLNNPHSVSLEFCFEKFGQHVATRYLQGTPSMTQESISLLPNSKVVWHFITNAPGEFSICLTDPSNLEKSEKRKVVIRGASVEAEAKTKTEISDKEKPKEADRAIKKRDLR